MLEGLDNSAAPLSRNIDIAPLSLISLYSRAWILSAVNVCMCVLHLSRVQARLAHCRGYLVHMDLDIACPITECARYLVILPYTDACTALWVQSALKHAEKHTRKCMLTLPSGPDREQHCSLPGLPASLPIPRTPVLSPLASARDPLGYSLHNGCVFPPCHTAATASANRGSWLV
jgi:hypothetical protein